MNTRGRYLAPFIILCIGLVGCTSTNELTAEQEQQFVDGANTIILTRMDPGETIGQTSSAMDLYTDAVRELENAGFEMAATDADQMIFQTEPREIESGMAIQIVGEVRQDDIGAKLLASAMHAPSATASASAWEDVVWNRGSDEGPFATTYLTLASISHDEIGTAVE